MTASTYVQGHDAVTLKSHQSRSAEDQADYVLPYVREGSEILDVGCGPGTITCGFAKYATQGHVVGVDYSTAVIEQARQDARQRDLGNISFQVASAHSLPFPDDTFDIVHCHAVLVHLPNPAAALKEMHRVCKPAGHIAAREPDWSTCVIHPYNPYLEKWKAVHMQLKQKQGAEPNAGRHLAEWALAAGFLPDNVKLSSNTLHYSGKESVKWWGELYAARMRTEFGSRAVDAGLASAQDIDQFVEAYLAWSKSHAGVWAMTHMRLLCRK